MYFGRTTIFLVVVLFSGYSETDAISARIHVHPVNISFDPGDNVTLTCLVEQGGPADVIDWYKDDQPISSRVYSNSSRWTEISLINITREDAGKYECTVRKRDEKDTDIIQLHVNGAPRIMALDTLVDVIEKEDKMITCQADGWPPPMIKWKRNNVDIKDNDDFMIWEFPNQNQVTLTIKSVDNHHEGNYTCEASNAFGKTSQNVLVTIQVSEAPNKGQSLEIKVDPRYVIASKGSNVTLKCDVLHVRWYLALTSWEFNETYIPQEQESSRYHQSLVMFEYNMTMVLDILNVSQRDEGRYDCNVYAAAGDKSANITLIVDRKDNVQSISSNWKTLQVATNTEIQLKCTTTYPAFLQAEAETFWMFEGEKLNQSDSRYKTDTSEIDSSEMARTEQMTLIISNVSESDFGNYSCAVYTSLGMSVETILLAETKREMDFLSHNKEPSSSSVWIVLFPVLAGGLFLGLTTLVFLRKLVKKRHEWKLQGQPSDGQFKYDVFVTFSNKDRQWVASNMIPLLERNHVKYCIHSRDFELGRSLTDNMAESVYSSRKVLAVMSKNYLDSKFCRGELEMALYRSKIAQEGSLLVVRIDGIKKKKMPKALREQTFVDYHNDKDRGSWEKKLMRFLVETELNQSRYITKL